MTNTLTHYDNLLEPKRKEKKERERAEKLLNWWLWARPRIPCRALDTLRVIP